MLESVQTIALYTTFWCTMDTLFRVCSLSGFLVLRSIHDAFLGLLAAPSIYSLLHDGPMPFYVSHSHLWYASFHLYYLFMYHRQFQLDDAFTIVLAASLVLGWYASTPCLGEAHMFFLAVPFGMDYITLFLGFTSSNWMDGWIRAPLYHVHHAVLLYELYHTTRFTMLWWLHIIAIFHVSWNGYEIDRHRERMPKKCHPLSTTLTAESYSLAYKPSRYDL